VTTMPTNMISCASFSFPLLSLAESARVVKACGFSALDVCGHAGYGNFDAAVIEADPGGFIRLLHEIGKETDLTYTDLFVTFGKGFADRPVNSPDATIRRENRQRFTTMVRVCRECGIPGITLLPGVIHEGLGLQGSLEQAAAALGELVGIAQEAGLRLSVEPHVGSLLARVTPTVQLLELTPGLTLALDYSHYLAAFEPVDRIHQLLPAAGHLHARQAAPGRVQMSHRTGTLDFADILRRARAAGFAGSIAVEYTWQEWERCNEVDTISESILLRRELEQALTA
jgi:sugar phosphate isomerase/epimerase